VGVVWLLDLEDPGEEAVEGVPSQERPVRILVAATALASVIVPSTPSPETDIECGAQFLVRGWLRQQTDRRVQHLNGYGTGEQELLSRPSLAVEHVDHPPSRRGPSCDLSGDKADDGRALQVGGNRGEPLGFSGGQPPVAIDLGQVRTCQR
jgi:hypothetical protein